MNMLSLISQKGIYILFSGGGHRSVYRLRRVIDGRYVYVDKILYKAMKKESGDLRKINKMLMFFGIGIIILCLSSFISVLRF